MRRAQHPRAFQLRGHQPLVLVLSQQLQSHVGGFGAAEPCPFPLVPLRQGEKLLQQRWAEGIGDLGGPHGGGQWGASSAARLEWSLQGNGGAGTAGLSKELLM